MTTQANVDNALDSILATKNAPAYNRGVFFENDMKYMETVGAKNLPQLFGKKLMEKDAYDMPANFGSKASTGFLPDDVRTRFFQLKKMLNNMEMQAAKQFPNQHVTAAMYQDTPIYKNFVAPMLKAYNVTDFASWIETLHTRFYFEEYEIPFVLADLFDQIPMESPSMEVPGNLGLMEGVEETDDATFNPQYTTPGTIQLNARNNVVHTKITQDLMSDSSPAYMDAMRKNMLKGVARAMERAIINGDVTQTSVRGDNHQDEDTRALALNATFSKAFNGLRKKCFAAEAAQAGKFVYDHSGDVTSKTLFANLLALMGPMGSEKDDLAFIVPSVIENALVTGGVPELFTAFAFGGLASNVTGQCPPIFGVKVHTSAYARDDLEATGKYESAGAKNKTAVLLVKKSRFAHYVRQAVRVWAAPSLPSSDQLLMSAKMRHTWNGNPLSAPKEVSIAMGINVAKL